MSFKNCIRIRITTFWHHVHGSFIGYFYNQIKQIFQELVECCADMNSRNGTKELTAVMAKISNFYHDCNKALEEATLLIQVGMVANG